MSRMFLWFPFFLYNDTATTEIYTLSLHDALPIYVLRLQERFHFRLIHFSSSEVYGDYTGVMTEDVMDRFEVRQLDRKSTRLNSSHTVISYAVFCLKKKK